MCFYISTSCFFQAKCLYIFSALSFPSNQHQSFQFLQGADGISFSKEALHTSCFKSNDEPSQTAQFIHGLPYQRLWKEGLGCISPRHKNRLTNPTYLITKNATFSSRKYNSLPQFRCLRDYLNDCPQATANNFYSWLRCKHDLPNIPFHGFVTFHWTSWADKVLTVLQLPL